MDTNISVSKEDLDKLAALALIGLVAIGVAGYFIGVKTTEFIQKKYRQFKCQQ